MKRVREDDVEKGAEALLSLKSSESLLLKETKKLIENYPSAFWQYSRVKNLPERILYEFTEFIHDLNSNEPDKLFASICHVRRLGSSLPQDELLSFLTKVSIGNKNISEETLLEFAKAISSGNLKALLPTLIDFSVNKYGNLSKGLTYLAVQVYLGKYPDGMSEAILSEFDHMISVLDDPQEGKREIANYMKNFAKERRLDLSYIPKVHKKILQLTNDTSIVDDMISWYREHADLQVQQAILSLKRIILKNNGLKAFYNIRYINDLLIPDEEKTKYKMKISESALDYAKEIFTSQHFVQALYAARTKCLKKFKNPQKDKDIVDRLIRIKIAGGGGYEKLVAKSKLSDTIISDLEWFVWKLKNQETFVLDIQCKMYMRYHFLIINLKILDHIKEDLNIFNEYIEDSKRISA